MRTFAASLVLAAAFGSLLPWVAVTLYGLAAFVQFEFRIAFAPGSIEHEIFIGVVFLLPSLTWGVLLALVAPKAHAVQLVWVSGLSALAVWLVQTLSLGIPGIVISSASLLSGVLAGAFGVRKLRT